MVSRRCTYVNAPYGYPLHTRASGVYCDGTLGHKGIGWSRHPGLRPPVPSSPGPSPPLPPLSAAQPLPLPPPAGNQSTNTVPQAPACPAPSPMPPPVNPPPTISHALLPSPACLHPGYGPSGALFALAQRGRGDDDGGGSQAYEPFSEPPQTLLLLEPPALSPPAGLDDSPVGWSPSPSPPPRRPSRPPPPPGTIAVCLLGGWGRGRALSHKQGSRAHASVASGARCGAAYVLAGAATSYVLELAAILGDPRPGCCLSCHGQGIKHHCGRWATTPSPAKPLPVDRTLPNHLALHPCPLVLLLQAHFGHWRTISGP